MRIGILAKGGVDWIGGVYYIANLIRALRGLPREEQPDLLLLAAGPQQLELLHDVRPLVESCCLPPVPDSSTGRTINPALLRLVSEKGIDLLFPCMRSLGRDFSIPWLPWIPDLQHVAQPGHFAPEERFRRDEQYLRIAGDARLIVLSSAVTAQEFQRAYSTKAERLRVLRFTTVLPEEFLATDPQQTARRFELPRRYLILPNQFWVHKNHRVAFEALRILAERGLDVHLVCTGRDEDPRWPDHAPGLRDFIRQHHLSERIRILGLLPREVQIQLVRAATAVVQPSLFEGWSTVVEDARALGKPIFLSDIPVHREQDPPKATYFPPHEPESLAEGIFRRWADLPTGFFAAEEEPARQVQRQRVSAYAQSFVRIAKELVDVWGGD